MNIIQYNDNDQLHNPQTDGATVYTINSQAGSVLRREEILTRFPSVFSAKLDGEYTVRLDQNAKPVQQALCRVAVALRPQLKETPDDLVDKEIIALVTTSTPWISSLLAVPKKNRKLRLCLDPHRLTCPHQQTCPHRPTSLESSIC